jgi:hypothetical protein
MDLFQASEDRMCFMLKRAPAPWPEMNACAEHPMPICIIRVTYAAFFDQV